MKERPILFNAEMVKAILDGRKTQTRRPMKEQPPCDGFTLSRCVSTTGPRANEGRLRWLKTSIDGFSVVDEGEEVLETRVILLYQVPGVGRLISVHVY